MTSSAHGQRHSVASRERHRCDHVGRTGALDDQRRTAIGMLAIPDQAGLRVCLVAWREYLTANALPQFLNSCLPQHGGDDRVTHLLPSLSWFGEVDRMFSHRDFASA